MQFSIGFAEALDLIADVTGHHPLCVNLVGKHLAAELSALGHDDLSDKQFLLILTDALTEGDICAGDALGELFADLVKQEATHDTP